jgi:hypothetical protein
MPMRTRDWNGRLLSTERNSGVAMEKSVFSTVPRWSGPSEARSRRSSVLPRAADRCLSMGNETIIRFAHSDLSDFVR